MAADPVAAAQALAGQTYADAQTRTNASKQALLDQLSTQGTYQNQINASATQAAAPQPAPTPLPGAQLIAPQLALIHTQTPGVQDFNQAALGAAAALAAHNAQAQQSAAGNYFDQVAAAVPIEQSRAASSAAQVLGDLQAKREAAAAQAQQNAIQLEISKAELAKAQLGANASNGGLSVDQIINAKGQGLAEMQADPHLNGTNAKGQIVQNRTGRLAQWLAATPGATPAEINAQAKNLGIDDSHVQYAVDAANNYYRSVGAYGVYGNGPAPSIQWAPTASAPMPAPLTGKAAESLMYPIVAPGAYPGPYR